jgi:pimeloyl-ACP methyl ester carboxylesterase
LAADVAAVAAQLAGDSSVPVVLAAHDWGGIVAWAAAILHPERFAGLAAFNAPHPAAMQLLDRNALLEQIPKSWYIAWFQLPVLADRMISRDYERSMRVFMRNARDAKDVDIARYVPSWFSSTTLHQFADESLFSSVSSSFQACSGARCSWCCCGLACMVPINGPIRHGCCF